MPFKVEQVDRSCLEAIVDFHNEVFMHSKKKYTLEQCEKELEDKDPFILVAKDRYLLVAASISYEVGDSLYIWVGGVLEGYRNQGIASEMIKRNAEYARSKNLNAVTMQVFNISGEMLRLATKLGYESLQSNPEDDFKLFKLKLREDVANMPVDIKEGELSDLEKISMLNYKIFKDMYEDEPYPLEEYKKRLEGREPYILMAMAGGKIVGDSIAYEENDSLYLWAGGVAEAFRNRGIASEMLELNEQFAKKNNFNSITVKVYNVSKEMRKLLDDRGYWVVGVDESKSGAKFNALHYRLEFEE